MSDRESDSSAELSAFMDEFKLKDGYGNGRFTAQVQYSIDSREAFYVDADIRIDRGGWNNSGRLTLLNPMPLNVPIEFSANFQTFRFFPGSGLEIKGIHQKKEIGKYMIYVIPKS
jgi:hypothetical protein